jgi:hypothetical protein
MDFFAAKYSLLALIGAGLLGFVFGHISGAGRGPRTTYRSAARPALSPAMLAARLPPTDRADIEQKIAQGHLIDAIRSIRAALGCGLKEGKDVADYLAGRRGS